MAVQKPVVLINGTLQQIPAGDTLSVGAGAAPIEPVTVWNSGSPEVLFDGTGDVVMEYAA